jgi:uncharacterized NAD-dependent epimerase/dehydratase family protein
MNMKDSGGASNSLVSASKLTSDGGKVASEFLVGGKFNEAAFLQKTAGELAQVAQVGSATPVGAKVMLLIAAAEKAKDLLAAVKQHGGGAQPALHSTILQSISDRLKEIDELQAPADQPTAPGVR